MARENAPLKDILKKMKEAMEQLKGRGEVNGPFSFGTITEEGVQLLSP